MSNNSLAKDSEAKFEMLQLLLDMVLCRFRCSGSNVRCRSSIKLNLKMAVQNVEDKAMMMMTANIGL